MERQTVIMKEFMQQQDKYCYFIISVSVTAIGFSVYQTTGQALQWIHLFLGLSNLCWIGSIFCGIKNRAYVISTLYANKAYFDILDGIHPGIGNDPNKIKPASQGIMDAMNSNSDIASKYFDWQERLFYSGIILFIFWHVTEMYRNT